VTGLGIFPYERWRFVTERKCLVFNFADIEVREREFLLIRRGERLPVEPTAFRVLLFMLRNPGQLVSKEEIVASVWNDIAVSDNSLTRAIAQLRRVLDDDSREPRYILTVPTLGYRFLCEVAVREEGFSVGTAATATAPEGGNGFEQHRRIDGATTPLTNSPAAAQDVLSVGSDEKQRETSGSQKRRARKLLFACIAVALFLLLAAGVLRRLFTGDATTPAHVVQHLAMEQRLTANPSGSPLRSAVVSPDGKYVAYADPTGLYLRQISNGETRPWSLPKDFVAWPFSWFPDGVHLLIVRIAGQPQDLSLWKPSLYKLSILGGDPQQIMNDAWAGCVSPDGSRIAYLPTPNFSEMWIMDSDGANPRKVVSSGEVKKYGYYLNWISPVAWSPTGQHLAYIENHAPDAPPPALPTHMLRIIGANGERATVVLNDPRIGEALWWGPDGRILFSYREDPESGQDNYGVYAIKVDERTGKAAGPALPITQAEGRIGGISGTADGKRLVVLRSNEVPQVFIADRDAASHRWKEPRRLTLDDNVNLADTWTADSKAVLFVSNRNGTWKLFKQNIDETTPEVLAEGRRIATPRLSPDGSQVLYLSSSDPNDASLPASLMSRPLAGGTPHTIIQEKGIYNHQCAKAPSTLCILSQLDGQDTVLRPFDLEHGAGRELMRIPDWSGNWSLSSDGSKLVIFLDHQHHIRFVSLGTGAAHDVTIKDWPVDCGDWAADRKSVFMSSYAAKGLPVILEVDQTGKAKVVLRGSPNTDFSFMIQSPDARYGLVVEGIPSDSNAWIVNDF
jgi:Tol biopolymer transport system component/DNA-binding winged helix-turn-helix (wHTH) protein